MITLTTLPQATAQEVFDQVAAHLLKQNHKALGENGMCEFRGFDGSKCAAGALIDDEEYDPSKMAGESWASLLSKGLVPSTHEHLINRLQEVRDQNEPELWPEELETVAHVFDLHFDPLIGA